MQLIGKSLLAYVSVSLSIASAGCAQRQPASEANRAGSGNPLLEPWGGEYETPHFDRIQVSDFEPALDAAMDEQRHEIRAIAENAAPATFENTLAALEKAGQTMRRVVPIYNVWHSSLNDAAFQAVDTRMAPRLAAFQDEIYQNARLFKRIDAVYGSPDKARLNPEQQRLVWRVWTSFVLNGARLDDAQKKRVAEINQRQATLSTQFTQNELADEEHDALVLEQQSDLAGLPASFMEGAAEEAARRGLKGKWVISNTRSSMEPFLTYSSNRALREKGFRMWASRGDHEGAHDNNPIVTEILMLRAERSRILGYPTYAHWHLADTMAKDPATAMDLMMKVWKPAVDKVRKEVAAMQKLVDAEGGAFKIQPWDYRYYAEKVRKARYDFDADLLKPYLQLENIRKAMFFSAGKLYGLTFVPLKGVPVFNDKMSVYKVVAADGKTRGIWFFDPYARPAKNSGAWMDAYREQSRLDGKDVATIVSNNANFIAGKPGEPVLISWDDAVTMFHEFGHALHGLNSSVTYPTLSGTNTAGDFVEFPSQFNENYVETPEVLKFLTDRNGHRLPESMIRKIKRSKTFNSGFATVEFLASAIVDMKLHLSTDPKIDPRAFEKEALQEIGMPSQIIMRHRIPHFGHLFSSEGYAAGYYGYLWAQVLDHDAFEAFTEAHGPYDPVVAKRFRENIMSIGNTVDPAVAYRKFRGRDAKVDALLRERGFPVP